MYCPWYFVYFRVAVLGCEMETTRGTSEGASASKRSMKPRDEAETLASCCRQQLAMSGLDLWKLADVVIAWLQGCGLKAATESRCYSVRGLLPGAFMGRDEAIYEAFASWFKPSSELVCCLKYGLCIAFRTCGPPPIAASQPGAMMPIP
jgi:hypothetical protein